MTHTGVFATPDEIATMKAAAEAPYIIVGGMAPESPLKVCHRIALAHDLPEIEGYYGCDLSTGEFLEA